MKSHVFTRENLSQSKIYPSYRKHAQTLSLIDKNTEVLLFAGEGGTFIKYPYLMCTDSNVIISDPTRILNNTFITPYKSITNCSIMTGKINIPKISLAMFGRDTEIYDPGFLTHPDAQAICNFILDKMQGINTSFTTITVVSETQSTDYSELEKLAEMKDRGIITEEEFQAKKKQILGI